MIYDSFTYELLIYFVIPISGLLLVFKYPLMSLFIIVLDILAILYIGSISKGLNIVIEAIFVSILEGILLFFLEISIKAMAIGNPLGFLVFIWAFYNLISGFSEIEEILKKVSEYGRTN